MNTTTAARRKIFLCACDVLAVCLLLFLPGERAEARAAQETGAPYVISKILFEGNRRIQRATLLARIFSRPGDAYNVEACGATFRRCGTPSFSRTCGWK